MDTAPPDAASTEVPTRAAAGSDDGHDRRGAGRAEETTLGYFRSPRDLLRLVAFGAVALVLLALTKWVEDSILGLEQDLLALASFLTPSVERVLFGVLAVLSAAVGLLTLVVPIATRRYRIFGYVWTANTLVWLLVALVEWWLDRSDQTVVTNLVAARGGLSASDATASASVAQMAANFVVLGPFLGRRWRRAGVITLGTVTVLHVVVAVHLPANVFVALPLGGAIGAAVLLAFGRPDRRPTQRAIITALCDAGLSVVDVAPAEVDARGSTPYLATQQDGSRLFVKVLGAEERAADLLFRTYRFLRLRNVGDDRPFSSLRRTVEHEALVALQVRDQGIRTPRLRAVVDVGSDSMLLAYELIDGRSLDSLPDDQLTDELARSVWRLLGQLRANRVAHRDLRRANVFVAADGEPWLIDFGFSELAAADELLDADVAQLLASFAVVLGPERAVDAAIAELGPVAVGDALGRLQMPALSGATQTALRERPGVLAALQARVANRCGVEQVELQKLVRVDRRSALAIAALGLATYVLVPQFSDPDEMLDRVAGAQWAWTALVLAMTAISYVAAAASLSGAIVDRVPLGSMLAAQAASSYAGRAGPSGLGAIAFHVRFLQRQGVDRRAAEAAVALDSVAGIATHVGLLAVFVLWAGRDAFDAIGLSSPGWLLAGAVTVGVLGALSMAVSSTRRLVVSWLGPLGRRSADGARVIVRRPAKVALLVVGSVGVSLALLLALFFGVVVFGGGLPLATVGAVYLVGMALAHLAPTPGGLGAVEAALVGGLVAVGLDHTVAIPAVFLFRLASFWLPMLPGRVAFRWLQGAEHV